MSDICTLRVKDQVNVKFEGLDPKTRRKIHNHLAFFEPDSQFKDSVKAGRWNGYRHFFSLAGSTSVNLLDYRPGETKETVLELVRDSGYEIDLIDERPDYNFVFPEINKDFLGDLGVRWPENHRKANELIELEEHQVTAINTFFENIHCMQELPTGSGKAQPLDSKILTPTGWVSMGSANVGMSVVCPDGTISKINGVFPQGKKKVYEITFSDGRTARSCGEHLWKVYNKHWTHKWKVMSLDEIINSKPLKTSGLYIPLIDPLETEDVSLEIDPYTMGALLGDGNLTQGNIRFSSKDEEILEKVKTNLKEGYEFNKSGKYDYRIRMKKEYYESDFVKLQNGHNQFYMKTLQDFGLLGCHSDQKFIPENYINSSVSQKLELIQGLMDTDGYVGKNGELEYTTVSKKLAENFVTVIRSIGGMAKIKEKKTTYTHNKIKKVGKLAYTISIRYHNPKSLVSLERKKSRIPENYQYSKSLRLKIVDIKEIEETECQCISVDHKDHLYITDDYIVTHNTAMTAVLALCASVYGRVIVIVPSTSLVINTHRMFKLCGLDAGMFYQKQKDYDNDIIVATWQGLEALRKKDKNMKGTEFQRLSRNMSAVIVDEAHGAKAECLKALLMGPYSHVPIRWGLTGTIPPEECYFASLLAGIGPVVHKLGITDLQEAGFLSHCHIHCIQTSENVNFASYHTEKDYLLSDELRLKWLSIFIEKVSKSGNVLVLVEHIKTGKKLQKLIPNSVFVSGEDKADARQDEYDSIHSSDNKVLIATFKVAAVGIDIPRLFNLITVEAGKGFVRTIQSIGRSLRRAKDKDYANVYDISSKSKYSNKHRLERKKWYDLKELPWTLHKIDTQEWLEYERTNRGKQMFLNEPSKQEN